LGKPFGQEPVITLVACVRAKRAEVVVFALDANHGEVLGLVVTVSGALRAWTGHGAVLRSVRES
jgi:hypothetical protein